MNAPDAVTPCHIRRCESPAVWLVTLTDFSASPASAELYASDAELLAEISRRMHGQRPPVEEFSRPFCAVHAAEFTQMAQPGRRITLDALAGDPR